MFCPLKLFAYGWPMSCADDDAERSDEEEWRQ
jgi:hypothetical protein